MFRMYHRIQHLSISASTVTYYNSSYNQKMRLIQTLLVHVQCTCKNHEYIGLSKVLNKRAERGMGNFKKERVRTEKGASLGHFLKIA